MKHEHNRGQINHSAVGALVTSNLFRCKTEAVKKGRGSFKRKRLGLSQISDY